MKIKRYFAAEMRQALQMVREQQGPDAVILSNRKVDGGVEIVAAVDYDEQLMAEAMGERRQEPERPVAAEAPGRPEPGPEPAQVTPLRTRQQPKEAARPASSGDVVRRIPDTFWSQDPVLKSMREEIHTLRGILEGQLSGLAWGDMKKSHPLRAKLLERLLRLGLAPELCRELADRVSYTDDPEHNWRQALGFLARRVGVTDDDILSYGGVVALVGPTGVGKTTTVAKLAARYALRHGPNQVALITTDGYRIGAHQQLKTYGKILGMPVHAANDVNELRRVLELVKDKTLVLIDTAGMGQRDVRLAEQASIFEQVGVPVRSYVVLSAATQRAALEETVRTFGNVALDGAILTKVDETASLGEALSVVSRSELPVAYVADGQRVPEDLQPARANTLVTRSVGMMRTAEAPADEALAFSFGGI